MAVQAVSLVIVSILASSVQSGSACNETQCTLLPVKRDVVRKFQTLAAEKGVRIIYLDLEIGNDSYHPLESNERYFARRWVWANTKSEPMLALTLVGSDVYSLGLLKNQMRHLTVHLQEQQSGCLLRLSTHCQDNVVGKTLLAYFTKADSGDSSFEIIPTDCVCTMYIKTLSGKSKLRYACCSLQNVTEMNEPLVRCEPGVPFPWIQTMMIIQFLLKSILFLYCPVIPCLLPDIVFSLQHECEKEDNIERQVRNNQVVPGQQNEPEQSERSDECTNDEATHNGRERCHQREGDSHSNYAQTVNNQSRGQHHGSAQTFDSTDTVEDSDSSENGRDINPYGELLSAVRKEQEETMHEIPLDDASPITLGGLLSDYVKELPEFNLNFNLKMLFLCFIVLPFFLHLKLALIITHRLDSYEEFFQKTGNCRGSKFFEMIVCSIVADPHHGIHTYQYTMEFIGWVTLFVLLLCITPKDLLYRSHIMTFCLMPNCQSVSLGHEIRRHLYTQHHCAYDLTFFFLWLYMEIFKKCFVEGILNWRKIRQWRRVFLSLYCLFSVSVGLPVGLALGVIVLVSFLMAMVLLLGLLSPLGTFFIFIIKKIWELQFRMANLFQHLCNHYVIRILTVLMGAVSFIASFYLINAILNESVSFMVRIFIYTVMGLVLNAELATPYVAFILVVWRNMYLCYSALQSRYKEVKDMIAKHWKENKKDLPWLDNDSDETIPKELFWFVCGKGKSDSPDVLPLRAEICFMLRDMALILTFLSVSLFAILVFKSMNDISALVSTTFVFISGVIPTLIFEGFTKKEIFSGWNKIKIERKIKEAVKKYIVNKQREYALGRLISLFLPIQQ